MFGRGSVESQYFKQNNLQHENQILTFIIITLSDNNLNTSKNTFYLTQNILFKIKFPETIKNNLFYTILHFLAHIFKYKTKDNCNKLKITILCRIFLNINL